MSDKLKYTLTYIGVVAFIFLLYFRSFMELFFG